MFSRFLSLRLVLTFLLTGIVLASPCWAQEKELRVCADPNNLPFSNFKQQGFENRIAELVAADLHAHLTYVWQRMGRGFVREFLNKDRCDLLIGIPADFKPVLTTAPYYRSTYVFVVRHDAVYKPVSLEDPRFVTLKSAYRHSTKNTRRPPKHLCNAACGILWSLFTRSAKMPNRSCAPS
jgi:ABC-type amino acid transport/signal transduction systems, periplasmic component/domain